MVMQSIYASINAKKNISFLFKVKLTMVHKMDSPVCSPRFNVKQTPDTIILYVCSGHHPAFDVGLFFFFGFDMTWIFGHAPVQPSRLLSAFACMVPVTQLNA